MIVLNQIFGTMKMNLIYSSLQIDLPESVSKRYLHSLSTFYVSRRCLRIIVIGGTLIYAWIWPCMLICRHIRPYTLISGRIWPYKLVYGWIWTITLIYGRIWPYTLIYGRIWPCSALPLVACIPLLPEQLTMHPIFCPDQLVWKTLNLQF